MSHDTETIKSDKFTGHQIAKRMFWLAYLACERAFGMGALQARDNATEEDVWTNVFNAGDYPVNVHRNDDKQVYGDYVFGRMVKLGVDMGPHSVTVATRELRRESHDWSGKYPSYTALAAAAVLSLEQDSGVLTA